MSEQWLSIVEYARAFHVSDMTVRRRIKNGKLHAVLRDGKYYIPVNQTKTIPPETKSKPGPKPPAQRNLIKPHPQPQASYRAPAQDASPGHLQGMSAKSTSPIPDEIYQEYAVDRPTQLPAHKLVSFCESMIASTQAAEQRLEAQYRAKIEELEAQLRSKDLEISQLYQQVEDLQVLVKILEKKQAK